MIILVVRPRRWKELDNWSFGGGLFRVLFNIFFSEQRTKQRQLNAQINNTRYCRIKDCGCTGRPPLNNNF